MSVVYLLVVRHEKFMLEVPVPPPIFERERKPERDVFCVMLEDNEGFCSERF